MSDFTDVMVDIETLGTAAGSVVLSIGAVAFSEDTPEAEWGMLRSSPISVASCRSYGLTLDESTLAWWLGQEDAARKLLTDALASDAASLEQSLAVFSSWFPSKARLWGNGADFDNALLAAAFRAVGARPPWNYSDSRCFRTMKRVFDNVPAPEFQGVRHDALADALHQTRHLQAILACVRGSGL